MIKTYLGLGSNLDNPFEQLSWALEQFKKWPDSQLMQVSEFRTTKPVGFLDQADFLNAVVELETNLKPQALLERILALELERKRERTIQFGPRTLDIDILLYGDKIIHEPNLIIPHPRMWERDFVLVPLYEIAPHLKHLRRNS